MEAVAALQANALDFGIQDAQTSLTNAASLVHGHLVMHVKTGAVREAEKLLNC